MADLTTPTVNPLLPAIPPSPSGPTTTQPVVTSSTASADLTQKESTVNSINTAVSAQASKNSSTQDPLATAAGSDMPYADLLKSNPAAAYYRANGSAPTPEQLSQFQSQSAGSEDKIATSLDGINTTLNGGYNPADYNLPAGAKIGDNGVVVDQNGQPLGNVDQFKKTDASSDVNSLMEQGDQAFADYQKKIAQLENGTFPLTAPQQAMIDSIKQNLVQAEAAQKQANANYEGGINTANITSGRSEHFREIAAGMLAQAVSSGIAKIQELENKASAAIAQLQIGFQKDDYEMINSEYDNLQKYLNDKTTTIMSIQKASQDAIKQQADIAHQQVQDQLDSNKFTYQQEQDVINNAFKQAQITETQRHDLIQESISKETAAKGMYQIKDNPDGTQSIFNTATGKLVGTPTNSIQSGELTGPGANGQPISIGNTGIPLLDTNTKRTVSGVPYIDGTNLTGKQAQSIQLQAAQLGIPYIGKDAADVLTNIDTAKQNMSNIASSLKGLLPANGLSRLAGVGLKNIFESSTQMGGSADALASFNAYRSAAIQALRAMAGAKGLRINQAEIMQSVNQDIPKITDTVGVAQGKLAKVQSLLDSQERGLFGPQYDVMKADNSSNPLQTFYNSSPDNSKVVTNLKTSFPQYSDDEIMQIVRAAGPNISQLSH